MFFFCSLLGIYFLGKQTGPRSFVNVVLIVGLLFDEMQEPYLITKLESAEKTWKELSVCFMNSVITLNKLFHRAYVGVF